MYNSNNSALSKDTIFGAKNHTNINTVFSSASILEDISVAKAKDFVEEAGSFKGSNPTIK